MLLQSKQTEIQDIANKIACGKNYIFPAADLGKYLCEHFKKQGINIEAFIDNKKTGFIEEKKILSLNDIQDKNANIIVSSINYMADLSKQAEELGFKNIFDFGKLTLIYPELQTYNQAFTGLKDEYINNKEKYEQLRNILADEKSKQVLDKIIEYRKTFDISLYSKIKDDINEQYFADFMPKNSEIFIDGGAFDGDTILRALNYISPKKFYFFEPDRISLYKAKENLKDIKNIEFFPYGLSDKHKILKFNTKGNLGSCFSEAGDTEIECVALDEIVKENKAFIKLDIEGAEIDAINGAKRLIKAGSPFAICVYHKPSDIWKIPELILNILFDKTLADYKENGSIKFYLRHYTSSVFETVFYGVPIQ